MRPLLLPSAFTPTHETSGLPGFPAVDVFAQAGTPVKAGSYGRVVKLSGRPVTGNERPGGAYGLSVYWRNSVNGKTRYATHLGRRDVKLGQQIGPETIIGTVARSPRGSAPGSDHVHLGMNEPELVE